MPSAPTALNGLISERTTPLTEMVALGALCGVRPENRRVLTPRPVMVVTALQALSLPTIGRPSF